MTKNQLPYIVIYSDGACSGNPGPGGWGSVIVTPDTEIIELGGGEYPTTNNRMEISGALFALKKVANIDGPVHLFTDSTYLIRGITQWIWGWRKKGWKTAEGNEVSNRDLWEDLSRVVAARGANGKIDWTYVRGHTGNPGNERCDEIAVAYSQKRPATLFKGSLKDYSVNILDFPESEGLPEMRPKTEKVAAHSYLSVVDGQPVRHRDWPSCERRVKGRSGAKFKKTSSAADEAAILGSWGVDPSKLKEDF
ncbi:MAG: RNase H family protein [Bdellovibrionota bacterium]